MRHGFEKHPMEKSPLEELNEMLTLTEQEFENWKEIQQVYNLKFLAMTKVA